MSGASTQPPPIASQESGEACWASQRTRYGRIGQLHVQIRPLDENDFVFSHSTISGEHCVLFVEINSNSEVQRVMVRDLSSHGTFIDGKKIGRGNTAELRHGSELSLGVPCSKAAKKSSKMKDNFVAFIYKSAAGEDLKDVHPAFLEEDGPVQLYDCGKTLGSGAFAEVRLCIHKRTGRKYAAKIVDKKRFALNKELPTGSFRDEVDILKTIRNPYIVRVEDIFETDQYLTIILQYVSGGDLFDTLTKLKRYSEADANVVFLQMAEGVRYLHERGIAHRDLKPENFLVYTDKSTLHILMGDFGLARVFAGHEAFMKTLCGTPQYLAPEVVMQARANKMEGYTQAVDVWSLGVILYILLVGYPPFGPKDFDDIVEARYDFDHARWKTVSDDAKALIRKMLVKDPAGRATIQQVCQDAWLKGVEIPPLPEGEEDTRGAIPGDVQAKSSKQNLSIEDVGLLFWTGKFDPDVHGSISNVLAKAAADPSKISDLFAHRLVELIPWDRIRETREFVQREGAALFASPLQQAMQETDDAVQGFAWQAVVETLKRLDEAEFLAGARAADEEVRRRCNARQAIRRETLALLQNELPSALRVFSLLHREEELLLQHAGIETDLQKSVNEEVPIDKLRADCDAFAQTSAQVDDACRREEEALYQTRPLRNRPAADVEKARKAHAEVQHNLLVAVSKELSTGTAVARDVEKAKALQSARVRERVAAVQDAQVRAVQRLETIQDRTSSLQKCLDVESKKSQVEQAAKVAEDAFSKSKKRAKHVELGVELGDSSQADLEAAKTRVDECRRVYEDSLRQLLEVRALGYPELRSSAASKRDRFPNVPDISFDELEIGNEIGHGAFSDVFEAVLPLTGKVAFKQLRVRESGDELLNEAAAMWEVRHSNHVVQLLKVCTGKRVGLVMEFMEGGMLAKRLKEGEALDKRQVLEIWRDVLLGVTAIHESKQVHLDLKSDNILLDSKGRAKVGDFGTCKQQRQTMRATRAVGTLRWLAPEMFAALQQQLSACDVWSLGMLLYELVSRREPYYELEESQVVKAITEGEEPSIPNGADKRLVGWMRMCWQRDPTKRPTVRQLLLEVEEALTRQCGICIQDFPVGQGVLCSSEQHFKCSGCLDEEMGRVACQRVDGAIACNCGGVFDLAHTRLVVQDAMFKQWQRKVLAFKEAELQRHHQSELERERKRWLEEDNVSRIARSIETMLTIACPLCGVAFLFEDGCMAIQCVSCKGRFCGFCFQTFQQHEGSACHDHAATCVHNNQPNRSIFLPQGQVKQEFERIQIARITRSVDATLRQLDNEQRQAVLRRVDPLLRQRGINFQFK